jgi:hypothetical protein
MRYAEKYCPRWARRRCHLCGGGAVDSGWLHDRPGIMGVSNVHGKARRQRIQGSLATHTREEKRHTDHDCHSLPRHHTAPPHRATTPRHHTTHHS